MISSLKKVVNDHRSTLTTAASVGASIYVVRAYVRSRLEEVKDKLEQERLAKDMLKRRFDQSREDVEYTVMALLPELTEGILTELDVEEVTKVLQHLRTGGLVTGKAVEGSPIRPPSSLASSTDLETRSDTGLSTSGLQGWVEAGQQTAGNGNYGSESSQLSSSFITTFSGSEPSTSSSASVSGDVSDREQERPPAIIDLTSSIASITSSSSANSHASSSSSSRSKAQLWNTLKTLTFTRTLTSIYAVSLLTLFTSIQLTILAREKYVRGIHQMEQEERLREEMEANIRREMSFTRMAFRLVKSKLGFATEDTNLFDSLSLDGLSLSEEDEYSQISDDSISSLPESAFDSLSTKYLTLSYHLLHIGFRDLSARVQTAVEDVVHVVSLKTRLSLTDLHRLVQDIRRKVEWEITFEGRERKVTFEASCVPQTREMVERTLRLGGWTEGDDRILFDNEDILSSPLLSSDVESSQLSYDFESRAIRPGFPLSDKSPSPPSNHTRPSIPFSTSPLHDDAHFAHLLEETRALLTSSDFAYVLDACLDHAVKVLMDNLERTVFSKDSVEEPEPTRIRMASLLPPLAHWSKQTLTGLPSELVDGFVGSPDGGGLREVRSLMAIVFGRFEDNR